MTTSTASAAPPPHANGTTEGRHSTTSESTQTNGFSEPNVGKLSNEGVEEGHWSVESGMS